MAKNTNSPSIDQIVRDAVQGIAARTAEAIQRSIAEMIALELKASSAPARTRKAGPVLRRGRRPARAELTKWVADRRARRVPNFVIELTGGLDTKKKIVAKFGENATFEKGKPLPKLSKAA